MLDRLAEYLNGRYTDPNGLGRNIGLDPREGIVVESSLRPLIDEKSGYVVLGRSSSAHKKWRRKGLLQIGAVGELQETGDNLFGREVYIDAAFPHIMFICGKRGSGKSYTLGIFAEELIRSAIGVGVILVDPIGIFWSLKTENTSRSERKALEKWGLNPTSFPEVKVLAPGNDIGMLPANCDGPYTIGVSEMTAEDWCQVFDMDRFKTQGLLVGTAIDQVRSGYKALIDEAMIDIPSRPQLFSIGDIIRCMEFSSTIISKTGGYNPQTRRSVIARFTAAAGWGIFSIEGTPLRELTSPNRVTVLDVSDTNLGDSKRSLITGIIARKVLEGRIRSARKEEHHGFDETDPEMIPLTWLLIDEAHIILPHNKQTPASEALIEYAKQGRRPGCAMILATQRPASTSDEILSQVDILLGHNLALEDDMSALRRRVPAKLPQEFAVSDFIRGIPVGTAIVADQKTQQRSFLVRLRPRLSHHAGSSAMPKAFQEKKGRMKRPIPLTGTYIPRNMPSVLDPTPVPRSIDDIGEIEEIDEDPSVSVSPVSEVIADVPEDLDIIPEGPVPDLPWGSTIILRDRSKEDLEMFLGNVEGATGFMLLSADDPSRLSVPSGPKRVDRWFSETDSCPIRDPNGPEMALSAIENTIGETSSWVVVIDHVENMFKEHPKEKIRGMLKALHDRVFEGKHLLVIRWDGEDREGMLQGIFSVKDGVEKGPGPSMRDRKEGLMPTKIVQNGSLRDEELRWMCNVMGLPTDGNDTELLNRLLESGKGILNESSGDNVNIDLLKQVMHESTRAREENNRLLQRIKELESEIGVDTPAEPLREMQVAEKGIKKDRKLVVVWEDEEQQQGKVEQFIQEVEDLKSEIENGPIEGSPAEFSDTLFSKLMNKLDEEKLENRERLKRLEEILQNEMDSFRDELESQRKKMTASRRIPKLRVIKEKPPHMEHTDVKNRVLKRKVLKRGEEVAAVSPRIETNQALDIGKRNLKRSIFRGPKESIDDIIPYNILLYRFLVGYRGGLRRSDRESDVFIDSITGEIVEQGRTGLRRSEGLPCLLRMTDLEMDVFAVLTTSPKEPSWISKASGIDVARVKRSLSSLEKKGLVRRVRIEGNLDLFSIGDNIKIPSRPWVRDHGFEPAFVICKGERILTPRITVNDARTVIERLSRQIDIIEQDTVRYPIHVIKIRGEGRTRYIAVDGFGGRLDRRISNILKNIIEGGN